MLELVKLVEEIERRAQVLEPPLLVVHGGEGVVCPGEPPPSPIQNLTTIMPASTNIHIDHIFTIQGGLEQGQDAKDLVGDLAPTDWQVGGGS